MSKNRNTADIFCGRGVSFEEILFADGLGGVDAIEVYLTTRRNQIMRRMSMASSINQDVDPFLIAIDAIDHALHLLPNLAAAQLIPDMINPTRRDETAESAAV